MLQPVRANPCSLSPSLSVANFCTLSGFYNLIKFGYFGQQQGTYTAGNAAGFFRVVPGFVVQFGISGLPAISGAWENANIEDDPVVLSNLAGSIAFATSGPNTRTTQVYINLGNNAGLDGQGFAPFGNVTKGYDVVQKLYSGYGQTPDQGAIYAQGNAYLKKDFPLLDYTTSTRVIA